MYKKARIEAGLKLDESSFNLHIGLRTLCKYEAGDLTTPPDVALGMSRLYKKPRLRVDYCNDVCPIGQAYGVPVINKSLLETALHLIRELNHVKAKIDPLIDIVSDNLIEEKEKESLQEIMTEILHLKSEIQNLEVLVSPSIQLDVLMANIAKEKAPAVTEAIG